MKFKKHFLIFTLAWLVIVTVVSDIFLISAFRSAELDTEKSSSAVQFFAVPAAFAAVNAALVIAFALFAVSQLRRRYHSIEGNGEYPFFRNYVILLSALAAANTLLLYNRFLSVLDIISADERRRLSMLFFSEPETKASRLADLQSRIDMYKGLAIASTALMIAFKVIICFSSARLLVRKYHRCARTGYSQEVHP